MRTAASKGIKHSEETKAKLKAAHAGKRYIPLGYKHSEETKAKMSAASKGRKPSEEIKAKLRAASLAFGMSEEQKAKMAAAREKSRKFYRDFETEPLKDGEIMCVGRYPGYDCHHTNMTTKQWQKSI